MIHSIPWNFFYRSWVSLRIYKNAFVLSPMNQGIRLCPIGCVWVMMMRCLTKVWKRLPYGSTRRMSYISWLTIASCSCLICVKVGEAEFSVGSRSLPCLPLGKSWHSSIPLGNLFYASSYFFLSLLVLMLCNISSTWVHLQMHCSLLWSDLSYIYIYLLCCNVFQTHLMYVFTK